jgi:hypothetical protein
MASFLVAGGAVVQAAIVPEWFWWSSSSISDVKNLYIGGLNAGLLSLLM